MYVKKLNFVICMALALVVGFGVSFLFGNVNVESDQLSGDISKASRYNNVKEDPQLALLQEKLQNDKEYFDQTLKVMTFLQTRVSDLAELTEKTIAQCSTIEELQGQIDGMTSLNAKAFNTNLALTSVADGLKKMSEGKTVTGYEQASNNATAGFRKIENQIGIGQSFVEAASKYLEGKEDSKYAELAELVSKWTIYSYQDAKLNKSENNVTYWNNKFREMTNGDSKILLVSFAQEIERFGAVENFGAMENFGAVDYLNLFDNLSLVDKLENVSSLQIGEK